MKNVWLISIIIDLHAMAVPAAVALRVAQIQAFVAVHRFAVAVVVAQAAAAAAYTAAAANAHAPAQAAKVVLLSFGGGHFGGMSLPPFCATVLKPHLFLQKHNKLMQI